MKRLACIVASVLWLAACEADEEEGGGTGGAEAESEAEGEAMGGEACPPLESYAMPACDAGDPTCLFSLPDADVAANQSDDDGAKDPETEPANYACCGLGELPLPQGKTVTVTGRVYDFQTDANVRDATVEAFATETDLSEPIATATSGEDGSYTIEIDTADMVNGRLSWRTSAKSTLTTLALRNPIQPEADANGGMVEGNRVSVSTTTSAAIPAILGSTMPAGTAIVVGRVYDCRRGEEGAGGRWVANANGRIYDSPDAPVEEVIDGTEVYYFQEAFPTRRHLQSSTSPDGLFGILKVPSGRQVTVRAYGRIAGEETLLGQVSVPTFPDSVIITDIEPPLGAAAE